MTAHDSPGTALDKCHMFARGIGMIGAAYYFSHLLAPPLPVTRLIYRRFAREDKLKRLHNMMEWASFCTRRILGIHLDAQGFEHLPRLSKGHMYVSNHQSYSDIVVLMSVLDTVAFLSKKLVDRIPVIGACAYAGGTVYLERSSTESRQKALDETIRMCKESTAVVIFPEGTRSENGALREKIYPRSMERAHAEGIRVIPVAIHGTYRVIPKSMDRVRTGQRVAVRIGPTVNPEDHPSPEAYASACWGAVTKLYGDARAAVEGS